MSGMICHYCGAPAENGFAEWESSQFCDACEVVAALGSSVSYAKSTVLRCTDIEQLRRALIHERTHAGRSTMTAMLERRLRKLGVACGSWASPATPGGSD